MRGHAKGIVREISCTGCGISHLAKRSDTRCQPCKKVSRKLATKKYKQIHADKKREYERRTYSPERRKAKYLRKRSKHLSKSCDFCHTTENLTIDHIIPKALGGSEYFWNLRTLCMSCNSSRRHYMTEKDRTYLIKMLVIIYERLHDLRVKSGLKEYPGV